MQPAPAPRTNVPAIVSLICGILGCIPFITSLVAIILGIVGIKSANQPGTGGKGMAIAGLILGILGILGWGLFSGGTAMLYFAHAEQRTLARQFAQDISAGNTDAAIARCASTVKRQDIETAIQFFKQAGAMTSVHVVILKRPGTTGDEWEMAGGVAFANNQAKSYTGTIRKEGDALKIVRFKFE
jgi:hypothetical protein